MKKLQSKITNISLDSSRNSKYFELNSDIQETKSNSQLSPRVQKVEKSSYADSNYINFENSDLLNDALSTLRVDTPHTFHDSDSSITIMIVIADVHVDMAYSIMCQPESYINLSPHIVCVSFKEESIVTTSGNEFATEVKKNKIKMDMTVSTKRLFFWDKMATLDGYFLLPAAITPSPPKLSTSLRAKTASSLPKLMELHTQDPKGGEMRYQYIISKTT
jgi:hypothetical protein